jgi:hypothetical protein
MQHHQCTSLLKDVKVRFTLASESCLKPSPDNLDNVLFHNDDDDDDVLAAALDLANDQKTDSDLWDLSMTCTDEGACLTLVTDCYIDLDLSCKSDTRNIKCDSKDGSPQSASMYYLCGYVAYKTRSKFSQCENCLQTLISSSTDGDQNDALVQLRNVGGLCKPSLTLQKLLLFLEDCAETGCTSVC